MNADGRFSPGTAVPEIPAGLMVTSLYQPVVDLSTRALVGYEALARGPAGTAWESPTALFESARAHGTVGQLDWMCRISAFRGALEANLPADLQLFVNMEPGAMSVPTPPDGLDVLADAARLSVVVEITERDLLIDPAALLDSIDRVREQRWLIAIDDVGAETASLALLPFIRPDIIKLDMRFSQQRADSDTARILAAVSAESDRTGAVVLAEGIETENHLASARDLGATLGQGWLFGRPSDLPVRERRADTVRPDLPRHAPFGLGVTQRIPSAATPFALAKATGGLRRAAISLVGTIVDEIARYALATGPSTIVLATMPTNMVPNDEQVGRMADLARTGALLAIFGRSASAMASGITGVHGMDMAESDPLARELCVIVVSPQFTAAVLACEVGGDGNRETEPLFDYRLTYDRDIVLDAATMLLHRTLPTPASPGSGSLPVFGRRGNG
ncbi:MAG: EAL domain-containing protein [Rhodococcus sp. (in: high G+C Gram-positive bacteria)]